MNQGLIVGNVYKLSGHGTVIYCGVKVGGKMLALRPMAKPKNVTYLDKSFSSKLVPVKGKIYNRLMADKLHDELLLHNGDLLFFQQSHGVFVGEIEYLFNKTCSLKVGDKTKRVSLDKLFTYDQIIGGMSARIILRGVMQSRGNTDKKHEVSEPVCCAIL